MNENKKNGLVVGIVILSLLVVGLLCYIVYDKVLKNNNSNNSEITDSTSNKDSSNLNLTESEALAIGKEVYNNLYKYMHSFVDPMGLDKSEYNEKDVYNLVYYKHDNFVSEFYNIFSKNVEIKDVFREYLPNENKYSSNFELNDGYDYESAHYFYVNINNVYYVDSGCRAEGGRMDADEFKVEKIENNKITYSYKLFVPQNLWTMPEEMAPNRTEKEYKEYYANLSLSTLEIVKEDNTWKVNKASVPARCDWSISINN